MGLDQVQTAAEAEQYAALRGIRLTAADREAILKAQAVEQRRLSARSSSAASGDLVDTFNRLYPRFLETLIGTGEVLMTLTQTVIYRERKQPVKDLALKQQIEAVHRAHPAYGHRRAALHLGINHKRAQRVMAQFNLRPPRRRVNPYGTASTPHHTYHNLLNNLTHPHQVWCSDLSRLVYRGTRWYLTTIEDLATRQIIAANIGKRHDSQLVLATLHQAFASRQRPAIFHSDQGTEFMAQQCTDYLEERKVRISVSDVASPWQNGFMESFFGRFKQELGDLDRFMSAAEVIETIYRQIHYDNHHRIHTALKLPPALYAARSFLDTGHQVLGT